MPELSLTPIVAASLGLTTNPLVDVDDAWIDPRDYGAQGDGVTDDYDAFVAAVAAVPEGGTLLVPAKTHKITSPIVIDKHMSIVGIGMSETFQPVGESGALNHPITPGVIGSVLRQDTAATDVLQLSGSAISVHLKNLGLSFGSAIIDSDTGHGVNAYPSLVNGSGHDSGLMGFTMDNVVVYGHDGDHYAYRLQNAMLGHMTHLRAYGGGGMLIDCDSYVGNFGNYVLSDTYFDVFNAGTADGIRLQSRTAYTASQGHLNLIVFVRPQVNITSAAATAGTQSLWDSGGGDNLPSRVEVIGIDLETAGANPVDFGGVRSGTVVRSRGGLINGTPVAGFDGDRGYQQFTESGTFIVPDGVFRVRVRCVGSGGGGGGGGTNSAGAANVGGGGGGAGCVTDTELDVTPRSSYTITVGAGGTSGAGGAAGGNAGSAGGVGNQSSFGGDVRANGGGGGAGGGASSTTSVGGGLFSRTGTSTTQYVPGFGGPSQNPNGIDAIPMPPGVCGGGGGGAGNATLGGGGGGAATAGQPQYAAVGAGSGAASATANGVAGTTATTPGCGGGGGGGAPSGGAGGAGGVGAPGLVDIWW